MQCIEGEQHAADLHIVDALADIDGLHSARIARHQHVDGQLPTQSQHENARPGRLRPAPVIDSFIDVNGQWRRSILIESRTSGCLFHGHADAFPSAGGPAQYPDSGNLPFLVLT